MEGREAFAPGLIGTCISPMDHPDLDLDSDGTVINFESRSRTVAMNRRTILRSLIAAPGVAAIPEAASAQQAAKPAQSETPITPTVDADSLAETAIHTFQPAQFAALKRLAEILEPSQAGAPGAKEANAAAFLDFLIGQSPLPMIALYRGGLDALNAKAHQLYSKAFDAVTESEAAAILAPLREPWTYRAPAAVLPHFLRQAKDDIRRATVTSREYIAVVSQRRRNAGGSGQYWLPVE